MQNKIFFSAIFILIFSFSSINAISQDSTKISKKYFGVSLQPNFQTVITFAIIEVSSNGKINRTYLTRTNWLHQIVGIQKSVANPLERNILKEAGIESPDVINELWKLRYSEPPYDGGLPEKGWSAKPRMCSEGQMEVLKQFGIKTLSDYFYGENLLKLLNSMEDPAWVADYMNK